jgi:hypothetical protein
MITDDPLRQLAEHDVDETSAERIRLRAHAELRQLKSSAAAAPWSWYHRYVEPAALVGMGLSHLIWTFHDTLALFR